MSSQYDLLSKKLNLDPLKYHIINLDPYVYTTTYFEHAFGALHDGGKHFLDFSLSYIFLFQKV